MKALAISSRSNHKQSGKGAFAQLRMGVMTLALGASLAFGSFGFATPADARVSGARLDDQTKFCGDLQDVYDSLYAEVHNPATTPERRSSILGTMQDIGTLWDFNCKGRFGKISSRLVAAQDPVIQVQDMAPSMNGEPNPSPTLSQDAKLGLANRFVVN